jgi:uncharacterized protein
MRIRLLFLVCCLLSAALRADEVIPPSPPRYFNDYTGTVRSETAASLDRQLEQFERDTSSQVVVAMYSKMQSDTAISDYANRVFRAWKIGQAKKNNGVLLLIFKDDRKLWIEVGYGLEGALPDARAKQIIDREITPRFKAGDFDGGLTAGVNAILQSLRGEYKGTGRTANQRGVNGHSVLPFLIILLIFGVFVALIISRARRGTVYHRRGRTYWGPFWGGGWGSGGGSSSGSWGGGGGFSGGGGGFSGGGGSSGGGGAGGSW